MGARISEAERATLRAAMPEVLRELCGVTDVRRAFRCPSPDHDDRDPSARYYADAHTVHCFGCGRTWDVFDLVGMVDGVCGFTEQAHAVAEIAGVRLDGEGSAGAEQRRRGAQRTAAARPSGAAAGFSPPHPAGAQDVSAACVRAFARLYEPEGDAGRRYLRFRGFDDTDIQRFGLGFARDPREVMAQFRVWEPEAAGFVVIPFWDADFAEARYCMARTVSRGRVRNKEWRPKGVASPLWNEWMLSAGLAAVYVAEGLLDAMALAKMLDKPCMALGGTGGAGRFASVLAHTPRDARPGCVVVCMDEDEPGRATAARIAGDLDRLGIAHAFLPPYPGGAKDADEWLMAERGGAWEFEFAERFPGDDRPLARTRWIDGG